MRPAFQSKGKRPEDNDALKIAQEKLITPQGNGDGKPTASHQGQEKS